MFKLILLSHQQNIDVGSFSLSAESMGLPKDVPIEVQQNCLVGGKQTGSRVITLRVGDTVLRVVPTRGMAVLDVVRKEVRFGWDSPVKEIVHPSFINRESSGGLGWLEGFNEMLVRCGYQWVGHPGHDGDEFLTLHGRIQNTPSDEVILEVEQMPPYRVTLSGRVDEKSFKTANFELHSVISLCTDLPSVLVEDTLTNKSSYPKEYQAIYHNNFSQPILEKGAQVHVPVAELSPFNHYSATGLECWNLMPAPTEGFDEMLFNIHPVSDDKGFSYALLHNADCAIGVEVSYQTNTLPVLTVWKNTDTLEQGYVVGIEPGTSFAYNRFHQRDLGLVPTIEAGESKHFTVQFDLLTDEGQINSSKARIQQLQSLQPAQYSSMPVVNLDKRSNNHI